MPLPVITDAYQVSLVWTNASAPRKAVNTLHFQDQAGGQTEANLFADLEASVTAAMWSYGSLNSRVETVGITKLDGVSAGQTFTAAIASKWAGGNSGDLILQGAVVVSLKGPTRGPRGRNRIYLPWIVESIQANGIVTPANVTAMQAAWTAFGASMLAAGWGIGVVSALHNDIDPVASIVVRSALKTQRRRAIRT